MSATRPLNLLIYYGYLNSFNSAVNGWDNEKVALDIAKYDICIFGNGVADPAHPDYSNALIIIARLKAIKPDVKIYGYVSASQSQEDFENKVDQWEMLSIDGIFLDEAGYDFGVKRDQLNSKIIHVHSKICANKCFVNAWNIDHVIGTVNDINFPNSIYNTSLHDSLLNKNDYYLLESFSVNSIAYSENNGYNTKQSVLSRGEKAIARSVEYGIKLAVVGIIDNNSENGQNLFNFNYHSSILIGAEAVGSSDINYGAGSATVKYWPRQGTKHIGKTDSIVIANLSDDKLIRYGDYSSVTLDFINKTSLIQIW